VGCAPSPDTSGYVHPDAARLAAFKRVYENHLVVDDIYLALARRFVAHGVRRFAEIGGGRGPMSEVLAAEGVVTVVVDLDEAMLADARRPVVRGDLRRLPLADASVDGAAAVNCLYFLADPGDGLREARRVLRPGGLFVASSPSRWNDPELEGLDPRWGTPSTFDAEDAPGLVASVFGDVEVARWSVVAYRLPDRAAVADYLHAFNVPDWEAKAASIDPPMTITKKGAEVWARREPDK
jgi:SAM-dependent methyltransferase